MPASPTRPVPKPGVLDITAYTPGKSSAPGGGKIYKLSSNETPLGPSPHAVAAHRAVSALEDYPDGSSQRLRDAIAARYGLDSARILCGNGSDDLLNMVCTTYLAPGDEAVFTAHAFMVYRIYVLAAGATPVAVPETNLTADVDAILAAVTPRTKVVFLANPNNPTGTYLRHDEVARLHAGLPPHVLLVLDAAYAEYVRRNDYAAGIELVSTNDNVVMTRTFSKIHGLANLRIGWLYGPAEVIDALNRVRGPFNVNGAAIEAGIAAMRDVAHVENAIAFNERWRDWLTTELTALGLTVTPSVGNFLLIHFPDTPGKTARDADAALTARGLILRAVAGYGFPNALRLSIGTEEANQLVIETLRRFLNAPAARHG